MFETIINEGLHYLDRNRQLIHFKPNYPFMGTVDENGSMIEQTFQANICLTSDGTMKCLNGDIIKNNSVVEFTYDNSKEDPSFRWVAQNIRPGKEANVLGTALNVWRTMTIPITNEIITTGNIKNPQNLKEEYYTSDKKRGEYYTRSMKAFHNFIKREI